MTLGYTNIQFGNLSLNLGTLTRVKVPGTIKQKIGGSLVKHNIPGRTQRDWSIQATGVIIDTAATAATTARVALETAYDLNQYHYSDGLILASMIIEDLSFDDDAERPMHYTYSIKLIEFNQND